MKKNVIIYCRVSTDKQSKTGESLEVQEEQCRTYCQRNEYQVLAVFSEQFTGTKDKRPKVEEALDFIKNSELKVDHVIVLKIDRVSRGGIVIHDSFKKQFQDLGVSLKDTHGVIGEDKNVVEIEGINTDKYNWAKTNTNQIAENVTVMMSENERNTILQRLLGQAIKNNKRGYKVRDSEYGYKNARVMTPFGKKTIQVENLDESIYIKRMFELKARGDLSDKEITKEINLMGYKSRKKIKWNSEKTEAVGTIGLRPLDVGQLQRFLSYTVYAGIILEEWTGNKPVKAPYNGLVSIELWNKANRGKVQINVINDEDIRIEHYKDGEKLEATIIQKHKNYNPEYPFGKVLKCPECGGHLTAEKCRSKNGSYHHYYSCRGKNGVKHKNYGLRRDEINEGIISIIGDIKFNKQAFNFFDEISAIVFEEKKKEYIEKNKLITNNIQELETKKRHISENIQNILNYPDLLESQNEELQKIKKEISRLQDFKMSSGEKIGLERFKTCSKKVLEHLDMLVLQKEKPELIQLVFEIVYGGKIGFEEMKSRTPITQEFLALNTKKDFQKNGKSSLNRTWSDTDKSYQTLKIWVVELMPKIDKWQFVIDKFDFR